MSEQENSSLSESALPDPWNVMLEDIQSGRVDETSDVPLPLEDVERMMTEGTHRVSLPGSEILAQSVSTPEKILTALRPIGEKIAASATRDLRNALASFAEFSFIDVSYSRFGTLLAAIPIPSLIAPFSTSNDIPAGLVYVDHACASLYLETVLGGGQTHSRHVEGVRPYSAIEIKLFEGFIAACMASIGPALMPYYDQALAAKSVETQPRYLSLGRFSDPIMRFRFRFRIERRQGMAEIVLINDVLQSLEKALLPKRLEQPPETHDLWRKKLVTIAAQAHIDLDFVLAETNFSFRHLQSLKIGDTLPLNITQDTPVTMRAHKKNLNKGMIGRAGSKVAIRMMSSIGVS